MSRSKSRLFIAAVALLLLPLDATLARVRGEGWASARTTNFLVVCEAGEASARRAARQLERFRAAFARVLPREHFEPATPTTVVIFRDQSSYAPFKPQDHRRDDDVAGHFQPGSEVNYITFAEENDGATSTLLHEYAHLLLDNYFRHAPLWLKEGFAEFYSTARLSDDGRRLTLGAAPRHRLRVVGRHALAPLDALLDADQASPYYSDPSRRGLFYAQSWALVHHLAGDGAAGRARLTRYLELLSEGAPPEEAFARAFGAGVAETHGALSARVRRGEFRESVEVLAPTLAPAEEPQVRRLSRAETLARLGDMHVHSGRWEAAESLLREASALDPAHAATQLSFGVLRLRQGLYAEAREHLQRAVAAAPREHLALFYLADALQREGLGLSAGDTSVSGFEEKTRMVRAALRRVVQLAPDFVEAYRLLAVVELDRAGRPGAAAALVTEGLRRAPRRAEFRLLLAQVRLSEGRLDAARAEADAVARGGDLSLREPARRVLALVEVRAEQAARARARDEAEARLEETARTLALPCDLPEPGPQQKQLRFAGEQACGRLVRIECEEGDGVVLHVETAARVLRLRAEAINRIRFITYTAAVKSATRIACGPRDPANYVLVTFRPRPADPTGLDGDASAVEFIPPDWNR